MYILLISIKSFVMFLYLREMIMNLIDIKISLNQNYNVKVCLQIAIKQNYNNKPETKSPIGLNSVNTICKIWLPLIVVKASPTGSTKAISRPVDTISCSNATSQSVPMLDNANKIPKTAQMMATLNTPPNNLSKNLSANRIHPPVRKNMTTSMT